MDEVERDVQRPLADHETSESDLKCLANEYKEVIVSFFSYKGY
jgi:hypothetical protein